ncbi:MAG: cofactor-independent phosphoglycerate mutase [Thermodesulfobacteriota bacterium]
MKYAILIGDGMADEPIGEFGGKTPLEQAKTPNMDAIASSGDTGLFKSVPDGFPPGSDVANMSILGYDPAEYYSGRAPLEAASIGVKLSNDDVAFRCNMVSLGGNPGAEVMADYSAGQISTEEGAALIEALNKTLASDEFRFYPGKSYRHLMVWKDGKDKFTTIPAHDVSDKEIKEYLPKGDGAKAILALMEKSMGVLKGHPVNLERAKSGKKTADSIWLWGQGRAPKMPAMKEKYGLDGAMISAVDLMNGLGIYAGLEVIKVPGITGYLDSDHDATVRYALKALETKDFVCVHVEAPDEAGHQGNLKDKMQAIEDFDGKVVGPMMQGLKRYFEHKIMVITDHPTPVALKTHTAAPVPYAMYSWPPSERRGLGFNEKDAKKTGILKRTPEELMTLFFGT